jgi:hypothetical protein
MGHSHAVLFLNFAVLSKSSWVSWGGLLKPVKAQRPPEFLLLQQGLIQWLQAIIRLQLEVAP